MKGEAEGPTPRPQRIQAMLDMARLRDHAASPEEVAAVWQKAVESAGDAELVGMSIDGSLRSAYDAGHMAALALLAAHGLRPGGGQGHHEMAFAGAEALGHKALADLVPDSMEIRGLRKGSLYDPAIASAADRDHVLEWIGQTLPAIHEALLVADPNLAPLLCEYP